MSLLDLSLAWKQPDKGGAVSLRSSATSVNTPGSETTETTSSELFPHVIQPPLFDSDTVWLHTTGAY